LAFAELTIEAFNEPFIDTNLTENHVFCFGVNKNSLEEASLTTNIDIDVLSYRTKHLVKQMVDLNDIIPL
jgi:hypothetical protein